MKSRKGNWGSLFEFDGEESALNTPFQDINEEAAECLEEAHEALNRLSQKANKRGRLMKQPKRAEHWH